jgi:hypothetical protein
VYKGFDGAAGTGHELFRLVPRAGVRCTLGGYPGIALLGRHGHPVVSVGRYHDDLHPVRTLTFSHRHPARFDIRHPDFDPRTTKPCTHRIAAIRVIPPNETRPLTHRFRHPLHLCTTGAVVSPVGRHY